MEPLTSCYEELLDQLQRINTDFVLLGFVCALRSGCVSAAPPELGEDQRHPGAKQSPDASGADGLRGRGRHGPPGTTAPLAQPPGGQFMHDHTKTHTHIFHSYPFLPKPVLSLSPSTILTPCWPEKKNRHPGCCVTPGEAANCGLFTVSRPPGAWSLEPRPK